MTGTGWGLFSRMCMMWLKKREYVLEILNRINLEKKRKGFLVKNSVWLVIEMYIDSTPVIANFFETLLANLHETRLVLYSKVK